MDIHTQLGLTKDGVSIIANPLAGKKLTKKLLKFTKKAAKDKNIRRGVKEVVKSLRKGETSEDLKKNRICIIAGDISPMEVIAHLPILCEDEGVSYIYVSSKEQLGTAAATKRPTSCVLIILDKKSELLETLKELQKEIAEVMPIF